jgi:hypothetical protein
VHSPAYLARAQPDVVWENLTVDQKATEIRRAYP